MNQSSALWKRLDLQTPRPIKECMKLAYRWMTSFCRSVGALTSRKTVIAPALLHQPSFYLDITDVQYLVDANDDTGEREVYE